jgi:beta-phosphoglucomutase
MKWQGIIFDLDGVIADTAKFHFMGWKMIASEIGYDINESFNESLKGVSRMECLDLILQAAGYEFPYEQKYEMAQRKNEYYLQLISTMTKADILPGIEDLIAFLKENGCRLAIASVSKNAPYILEKLKLAKSFDYIVDAAKIQKGKPHPEIFIKAQTGLGLKPFMCVGIEDAYAGVEAIKAANMTAVGVGCSKLLKNADICVADTQSLMGVFQS